MPSTIVAALRYEHKHEIIDVYTTERVTAPLKESVLSEF